MLNNTIREIFVNMAEYGAGFKVFRRIGNMRFVDEAVITVGLATVAGGVA